MQRVLAVVPERRMPEIVGQTGDLHQIGIAAEHRAELARDLCDLEGVSQPRAGEIELARGDDLSLRSEAAQSRRVQNAGSVSGERRAAGALGRLGHPPLLIRRLVTRRGLVVTARVGSRVGHRVDRRVRHGVHHCNHRCPIWNHTLPMHSWNTLLGE